MNTAETTEIARLRDRIIGLLGELDRERDMVAAMRGHIEKAHEQIERSNETIRQWIASFEMTFTDKGRAWTDNLIESYDDLLSKYNKLVKKWNRHLGSFNPRHAIGRPLKASKAQQAQVRRLSKTGHTLREIADETKLSFQTVRTIMRQKDDDRATKKKNDLQKIEQKQHRIGSWRARKRTRDALAAQSSALLKDGESLLRDGRDLLKNRP